MEPPSSTNFHAAIATVSVAQICSSVGYTSIAPSALRAFSDIAVRYILSIGRLCAASAASHNRTDSNLFDLVLALETLYSNRGFSGGSDHTRPLLGSVVLKELMAFVGRVDEIPFAKPIYRERGKGSCSLLSRSSFAQMGKEVPMAHVPRWLPCFPDSWDPQKEDEKGGESTIQAEVFGNGSLEKRDFVENEKRLGSGFDPGLNLVSRREKIRFRIGIGIGLVSARRKRKKHWYLADD